MNHIQQVDRRIYAQYRQSPSLIAWLKITAGIANQFEIAAALVAASYNIETASSRELDIIGRIVGIGRRYSDDAVLTDDMYRLILRSKIWKNHSGATIDSIIQGLAFIIGVTEIRLVDNEDMSFSLEFFEVLTDLQRDAITYFDITPRPQGVRLAGFEEVASTARFGGDGDQFGRSQFGRFIGG